MGWKEMEPEAMNSGYMYAYCTERDLIRHHYYFHTVGQEHVSPLATQLQLFLPLNTLGPSLVGLEVPEFLRAWRVRTVMLYRL